MNTKYKRSFTQLVSLLIALWLSAPAFADKPFKVAILMFDDVQIIDFAAPYEVFGQARFDVFTVSKDGKPVTTVMGLDVTPTHSFATMPAADAVLIPGGNVHDIMADQDVQAWLKGQQKQVQHMLSVCTGSHILAETGLLNGMAATTFHRAIPGLMRDYPEISVQREKRFVDNGQIITSAGLSSGIDASLHLVRKVLGLERAKTIALHIEYDWDPDGGFVRAILADRMMPDNRYNWPNGVSFQRLSSLGDQHQWQTQYEVTTDVNIDEIVAVYKTAMTSHNDWKLSEQTVSDVYVWQGNGKNQDWQHSLAIEPSADPSRYTLIIDVRASE